ncbi:MAG: hypothetical protein IJ761_05075 [Bacteroidales bacterium]|nr:hypothetical protein [Bacteroidales bacterium]
MELPYKVDVVESVMKQVTAGVARPNRRQLSAWKISSIAAVMLLAIGVWTAVNIQNQRAMNMRLTMTITSLGDYSYYQEETVIEELAERSLEPFIL